MRLVIGTAVLALLLAACGGSSTGTTVPPAQVAGCEEAPQAVLDYLSTGFVNDQLTLVSGQAVKSGDYPDVWIVSAILGGAEDLIGDSAAIGTWAIRAGTWPTDYVGATAVDDIAEATTTWGDSVDIIVTSATDGVMAAQACAVASLDA